MEIAMNAQTAILQEGHHAARRRDIVRRVIEKISLDYRDQPSLEALAEDVGDTPTGLQKLFTRWAGLSPKAFLQAVTLDHARKLLDAGAPLLKRHMKSACPVPADCMTCSSRMRPCLPAITRRAAKAC
jgi:AraC family transcriptional regulator of adaptative response/methylated-DNA-[protein]-cysteine methyltransferase